MLENFLDGIDDFMLGTLVCSAIAGVSLLAFFFFKALLLSPYAVIVGTLALSAFILLIALCIVSIILQKNLNEEA